MIPDFLCSAGGETVSYFAMVQNFDVYPGESEDIYTRLGRKMTTACNGVLNTSTEYNVNMRQAAYVMLYV